MPCSIEWDGGISDNARYKAFMQQQIEEVAELYGFVRVLARTNVHKTGSASRGHKVGKLRLTLTTFDEKGVRNNGVHLNMVGRRANGPSWIDKISNRGPNYPYHEFTWGSITWGSKDNPVPGYGTKKVTTQREARQQYADKNNGADPLGGIAGGSAGTAGLSSINNNPPPPQAPGKRNVVYQDTTYVWDVTNARWYWTKPDRSSDWADPQWSSWCESQQGR